MSDANVLEPAKVFVSLQLIAIINEPLAYFPYMLAMLAQVIRHKILQNDLALPDVEVNNAFTNFSCIEFL